MDNQNGRKMGVSAMYHACEAWRAYYEELDTHKRHELLRELLQAAEDDGANRLREELFTKRYVTRKGSVNDTYLIHCLMLKNLYAQRKGLFLGFKKEVAKELAAFLPYDVAQLPEAEQSALYWEFRNTARRYLDASRSEQYGKKLMGLVSASADEKLERVVRDLWTMSRGIALSSGNEKRMRPFCDALYDELTAFDVRCEALYSACEAEYFT